MAVVHYVKREHQMLDDSKLIRGKLTIGTLGSSGTAALNLANYLKDDDTEITFVCDGMMENAANSRYLISSNCSNAEVITLTASVGGLGASQPYYAANAGLELTAANIDFVAIGKAH